jgi:hypothetical protein
VAMLANLNPQPKLICYKIVTPVRANEHYALVVMGIFDFALFIGMIRQRWVL